MIHIYIYLLFMILILSSLSIIQLVYLPVYCIGLKIISGELVSIIIDIIFWIFSIFSLEKNCFFIYFNFFFWIKTGHSLIDFDVILRIQSSEFTKSLNFRSSLKKYLRNKIIFSRKKLFLWIKKYLTNLEYGWFWKI